MKKNWPKGETAWCFAIVNGKLSEIHFEKGKGAKGVFTHCYINRNEYKTKREQKMIDIDIKKCCFTWRKGSYREI